MKLTIKILLNYQNLYDYNFNGMLIITDCKQQIKNVEKTFVSSMTL